MVILFYFDDFLMFSPSKDKIDEIYVSLQEYFKIEDAGELKIYPGIYLDCRPYGSIHIRQPQLTQRIIITILVMYK